MKKWVPSHVLTYAGYRGEEVPRSFSCGGTDHEVGGVLRRTNEQTIDRRRLRRFVIRTSVGNEYTLVQDVETTRWYVELDE